MTGINHEEDKKFGKIIDDWRCCNPSLLIYGENGNKLRYKITGECCQCGLVCTSCYMLYDVKFFIYEADCKEEDPLKSVGSIFRKKKDLAKGMFTDADNFDIYFPEKASGHEKLMIIGATLMLDYTYFENSNINNNRNNLYG